MIVTTDAAKAANDELTDCSVPARDVSIVSTSCAALSIKNNTYDVLSHLAESIEHSTLRRHVVPSHRRAHNGLEKPFEQDPRRPQRASVLRDNPRYVHKSRAKRDGSIDADVEEGVFLGRGQLEGSHRQRDVGRVGHSGVMGMR